MKKIYLLTVMLLISITSIFATEFKQDEKLIRGELANGLQYYIYPNAKPSNKISIRLRVKTGSLYEEENEQGIAHFIEHMAFNGTEKYPANDLIRMLESRGIAFGNDLNAFTSFDETVFKLDGQTKDLEVFLDILHQWGFKVTFDPQEVEKEKGIVIEEWRQNTGIAKEMDDYFEKYIFRNSQYLNRKPIGKVEMIESFNKQMVEGFYKKWYVPNNMELFIVGDMENTETVKKIIQDEFSKEKAVSLSDKEMLKKRKIIAANELDTYVNAQLTENSMNFLEITEVDKDRTEFEKMEDETKKIIFNIAFNNRYNEKLNRLDTNIKGLSLFDYDFNDYFGLRELVVNVKDGKELNGIKEGIAEIQQLKKGFSKEEIEEAVNNAGIYLSNSIKQVDNIETPAIVDSLMTTKFENKEIFISYKDYLKNSLEILDIMTVEEINSYIDTLLTSKEQYYLYSGYTVLDKETLQKTIEDGLKENIGDYKRKEGNGVLLTKDVIPGKIIKEEYNEELDYYILTLSNGSKVYVKNIDYEKNQVSFTAVSKGGKDYVATSKIPDLNFLEAVFRSAPGTMTKEEYDRYVQSKNFSLNYSVDDDSEYFYGDSSTDEVDEMLMNYYAFVTEPKIDNTQLEILKQNSKESIKNRDNVKANKFWENFIKTITVDDPREKWMKIEDVDRVDTKDVLDIYKDRVGNGIDYDYYIVGDIDYDILKESIAKYLASLTNGKKEDYNYTVRKRLANNTTLTENLGDGKESTVVLYFGDQKDIDEDFEYYSMMVENVLDTELIKEVREKMSGVYSISAWTDISKHNLKRGWIGIEFTCDPARVDEIISATENTVESVLNGNISDETISFIKEKYKTEYNRMLNTNDYYIDYFERKILGEDDSLTPDEFNELVSKKNIINFIETIYGEFEAKFILNPENSY